MLLQNHFVLLQSGFEVPQNGFVLLQNNFAVPQNHFSRLKIDCFLRQAEKLLKNKLLCLQQKAKNVKKLCDVLRFFFIYK